jgi:Tfp pilus assembly protein PilN
MPSGLGIEVGPTSLRALRFAPGRSARGEAMEVEWAPHPPPESIGALRERFGSGNTIAVALDMSVLFVKRLELPPLSMEERRRIVAMDPQRYFPVREDALVAGVRDDDLVVATRTPLFDEWMDALGALGSVERVEPAPAALTRYLATLGIPSGMLMMLGPDGAEATVARILDGQIQTLRKVPSGTAELGDLATAVDPDVGTCVLCPWHDELAAQLRTNLPEDAVVPVPTSPGAPDSFAVAHGALLGFDEGSQLTLCSPSLERRLVASTRRRTALHIAVLVAALGIFGWALDHRRSATLRALDEQIADAREAAAPVLELRDQAASLAEEMALLATEAASRSNPLDVLATLTRILPADAYLTQLSTSDGEWELNGLARDAARLVPLLEGSDLFADVRFRSATTRVRVRNESYENFALVFRHVPST